ncbi:pyrroloquinoline quinone biosynthesis peptide chaperone PqqD [Duganella sp. LX20W]|uniref:Pyrroloquinoline quinone biosynthesis peptide chaperone PqqD n=1 Tax=Rugamonas brunnea TaxID=2758569 RepID=A0A7W2EPH8_9BURK|nr:pyrroloquinoline quinone biosynthesis peptide chaperone PqqD [Rugamonas brunnea]MBA5636263.1 pyrroloquinoline quinone biosynthesis peptide chaperone PqqD [Rugamonas brunnea]
MLTETTTPKLSRLFRLQWEEAQQAYVLLYPEGLVRLNPSAAEILKRCDGKREVADIVRELEAAFQASDLDADVRAFLDEAQRRGWLG